MVKRKSSSLISTTSDVNPTEQIQQDQDQENNTTTEILASGEYIVEKILDKYTRKGTDFYLVKWKGYSK
jgi:hypothetical protein